MCPTVYACSMSTDGTRASLRTLLNVCRGISGGNACVRLLNACVRLLNAPRLCTLAQSLQASQPNLPRLTLGVADCNGPLRCCSAVSAVAFVGLPRIAPRQRRFGSRAVSLALHKRRLFCTSAAELAAIGAEMTMMMMVVTT